MKSKERAYCWRRKIRFLLFLCTTLLSASFGSAFVVAPKTASAICITSTGDTGGSVINEAGRFRRLAGKVTPPDGSTEAQIHVEGKPKMVEGFVRWCKRGNVGLNQKITVTSVEEEEPTGLYDDFYCKTHSDDE